MKIKADRNRSPNTIKEGIEFFTDQKSTKKMYITEDIDIIYRKVIERRNEFDEKLEMFIQDKNLFGNHIVSLSLILIQNQYILSQIHLGNF